MNSKRKVEIFSAGCGVCIDAIEIVKRAACSSCEVIVRGMNDIEEARRAKSLGILLGALGHHRRTGGRELQRTRHRRAALARCGLGPTLVKSSGIVWLDLGLIFKAYPAPLLLIPLEIAPHDDHRQSSTSGRYDDGRRAVLQKA